MNLLRLLQPLQRGCLRDVKVLRVPMNVLYQIERFKKNGYVGLRYLFEAVRKKSVKLLQVHRGRGLRLLGF